MEICICHDDEEPDDNDPWKWIIQITVIAPFTSITIISALILWSGGDCIETAFIIKHREYVPAPDVFERVQVDDALAECH